MQRLRLFDLRNDIRFTQAIGCCVGDIPTCASYANGAQERLLHCPEAGEESWFGSWAEVKFTVSQSTPYITLPRTVARLEAVNVCKNPVRLNNQFYEYLAFGNGRLPQCKLRCGYQIVQAVARNNAVTFVDLSGTKLLRAYIKNAQDVGKRILFSGLDSTDSVIYSQNGADNVQGVFLTLANTFATTSITFDHITAIQKDQTVDEVSIYSVDPDTGDEVLLLTMEASEQTAWYRRYYFDQLPVRCCNSDSANLDVYAIVKLEPIPVMVDTDYLVLQSKEAFINEARAMRYSGSDNTESKNMEKSSHKEAVRYLVGQLTHYMGMDDPALDYSVYGSARLENQAIGTML